MTYTLKNKTKRDLRVGSWNVRSLYRAGAFREIVKEADRYELDLLAVQETRWPEDGILPLGNFTFLYGGSSGRALGTGFLVKKSIIHSVKNFKFVNDRLSYIIIEGKWYRYIVINVHCPTEDKEEETKDLYYETVEQLVDQFESYDTKIVLGDFNAKIGREEMFRPTIGKESLHEHTNNNGIRVINFAASKDLIVKSTCFKHRDIHKATWTSPDGITKNQIDHFLIDKRRHTNVLDVRAYRGADSDSDHFLVIAKLRAKLASQSASSKGRNKVESFDIEKLKDGMERMRYQAEIANRFEILGSEASSEIEDDPNRLWGVIEKTVKEAANEVLGKKKKPKSKPWFDEECELWFERRKKAKLDCLHGGSDRAVEEYRNLRKQVGATYRNKKREYQKNEIRKIETNSKDNNPREMYRGINAIRKGFQSRAQLMKDENGNLITNENESLRLWKNYFDKLLNVHENEEEIGDEIYTAEPLIEEPTCKEVETALKKLKNNKAAGNDYIPAELLKYGGTELTVKIYKLICVIWKNETIPENWKESIIIPIFKKGDKTDCNNYRGISLLSTCYKVLTNVIQARLTPFAEDIIGDYQCGFRRNRSTTDQMFTIRQLMEKKWEFCETVHQLFIDFKKAYDSIKRTKMYQILVLLGVPKKLVKLIQICLNGSRGKVRVAGNMSESFSIRDGLKQGDGMSTVLFNLTLEYAVRKMEASEASTTLNGTTRILGYADDLDLVGDCKETVARNADILIEAAKDAGLEVSESKTKYMITDRLGTCKNEGDLKVGEFSFERVSEFRYLGTTINERNEIKVEINKRLHSGNACFYAVNKLLKSKLLSKNVKVRIYRTIILPVILYGCETWALTKVEENRFRVFENKVLRKIYGPKKDDETGEWRKLHNTELHNRYASPNIIRIIKARRLRWAGHVARMENDRTVARILRGKPNKKRPLGRPRRRWEDNVEADLVEIGMGEVIWEEAAQDRDAWRTCVDEAMNFRVPNAT